MIRLIKIRFTDERGNQFDYEIPKDKQIIFYYTFGSLKEEVGFVGGYIIALLPKDKKFLSSEGPNKLMMSKFGFQKGKNKVWFTIPPDKRYTVNSIKAGAVFTKLITAELL